MLINMAVNILGDVVAGAKAILQGVLLPLATPQEIVKTKNLEGLHSKRQLTSLGKVSLLVLNFLQSATNTVPKELGEEYADLTFAKALLCYLQPLSISRVAKICIKGNGLLSSCLICCKCFFANRFIT